MAMVRNGWSWLAAPVVLLVLASPLLGQAAGGGAGADETVRVVGVVLDLETGAAVSQALVALVPEGEEEPTVSLFTSLVGRFVVRDLPAGSYHLRVDRLGYGSVSEIVEVRGPDEVAIRVELISEALDLEPLVITATQVRPVHLRGFDQRREAGFGRFLDREDIERARPIVLTDALQTVRGVRIVPDTLRDGTPRPLGYTIRLIGGCEPMLVLDGMSFQRAQDREHDDELEKLEMRVDDLNTLVAPDEVEAIEIYHSGEIPAEFRSDRCGAVVVWTRRGGPGFADAPTIRRTADGDTWGAYVLGAALTLMALVNLR